MIIEFHECLPNIEEWRVGNEGHHSVYFMEGTMEKNGPEVAGEDYTGNECKDTEDALNEAIAGVVGDCIFTVKEMIGNSRGYKSPGWQLNYALRQEAIGRIKKILE